MTSVQNHQRPLSGNSFFIVLAALSVFLTGCFISGKPQKGGGDKPDVVIDDTTDTNPIDVNVVDTSTTTIIDTAIVDTVAIIDTPLVDQYKDEYIVTLILPLHLDSLYRNFDSDYRQFTAILSNKNKDYKLPKETLMSLQLYEGVLFAVEELEAQDLNVKLIIEDNRKSISETNEIVAKESLLESDLIIGPIYNKTVRVVSEFAKNNGIKHIVPLTPAKNLTSENPYDYKVSPSIDVHLKTMFDHITFEHSSANILMFSQSTEKEWEFVNYINGLAHSYNQENPNQNTYIGHSTINLETDRYSFKVINHLQKDKANIIFIPSYDEVFIGDMLRRLNKYEDKYDITVMGMPTWDDNERVKLIYYNNLNVHITQEYMLDEYNMKFGKIERHFQNEYMEAPSKYACIGYDIMNFFGELLIRDGVMFDTNIEQYHYVGIGTNLHFEPNLTVSSDSSDTFVFNYYENQSVHLVRFQDFEMIKLNK